MENYKMAAESAGGVALLKVYGLKAVLGMAGAALLFIALPPVKANGHFDEKEFVARLACAGAFSVLFGDWTLQMLVTHAPWLHAENYPKAVDLMTGAPAWWISRWIALWFQKRADKDLIDIVKELKDKP
jgi:hypothetical protein